jgi:eukaryotic-like serine/threonine-protein kinase
MAVGVNDNLTRPATLVEGLQQLTNDTALSAGLRLGPYRLIQQLGQGGMGEVWLADQLEPFERKVAIKLSRQTVSAGLGQAYFEIERQALAQLVHPYIAQIYDAGASPAGQLYFAMEYVDGSTLDQFAQSRKPSLDACAALLALICQGVHYAHQRGLIHRDLKPGNVLITQVAGKPMPKIIDFGIAIGVDSARQSGVGSTAGTRAYMAPEQLQPNAQGIDLRVDVFALGAILVELICNAIGINLETIDSNSFRSLLATRVQEGVLPAHASQQLHKQIPKALRAIALKAMAVERSQRYESAAALADDLQRWRERRPVLAIAGSRLYAIRCFINRYRLASALAAATLTALIVGLVVASYGLSQARAARAVAETRREQAEELVGYMLGDFSEKLALIGKLDLIDGVANRALTYLRQANDSDAASAVHRAAALRTIGDVQMRRGLINQAKETFALADQALRDAEALGPADTALLFERAQVAYWIGYSAYTESKFDLAKSHWLTYLEFAERLRAMTNSENVSLLETSYALSNLGTLAYETGELKAARNYFARAVLITKTLLAKTPENSDAAISVAKSLSWLARTQEASGELQGALNSYLSQLELCEKFRQITANAVTWRFEAAVSRQWIALLALQIGDAKLAQAQLSSAVPELESLHKLEPTQMDWLGSLATAKTSLAWVELLSGRFDDAAAALSEAQATYDSAPNDAQLALAWRRSAAITMLRAAQLAAARNAEEKATQLRKKAIDELQALVQNSSDRRSSIALAQAILSEASLPRSVLAQLKAMLLPFAALQPDAEVLDPLMRVHLLLREATEANKLRLALDAMGYQHPDYRAFLIHHSQEIAQ